jgi:hypothetical protein
MYVPKFVSIEGEMKRIEYCETVSISGAKTRSMRSREIPQVIQATSYTTATRNGQPSSEAARGEKSSGIHHPSD